MGKLLLENYKTLEELYSTSNSFIQELKDTFDQWYDVTFDSEYWGTIYSSFISNLGQGIYNYYYRDKVAYAYDETSSDAPYFMDRLTETLAMSINKYLISKNIEFYLAKNTDDGKYTLISSTSSGSQEKGNANSSTLQSSASTPTSLDTAKTTNNISIDDSASTSTKEDVAFTNDGYVDKYTNFQGKTNGVHKNEVEKNSNVTRSGNYTLALDYLARLPISYMDTILKDVSKHFIVTYDEDEYI